MDQIVAYIGIAGAIILIDYKATVKNQPHYLRKEIIEIVGITSVLLLSTFIAEWIKLVIGLPQIFIAMIISASLGALFFSWRFGPTLRALFFAGIPVVLAANFIVGGSQILDAFQLTGMRSDHGGFRQFSALVA